MDFVTVTASAVSSFAAHLRRLSRRRNPAPIPPSALPFIMTKKKKPKPATSRKASSSPPSSSSSRSYGVNEQDASRSPVNSSLIVCDLEDAVIAGSVTLPSSDLHLETPATVQIGDVEIDLPPSETIGITSPCAKSTVAVTFETPISESTVAVIPETPTANHTVAVNSEAPTTKSTVAVNPVTPTISHHHKKEQSKKRYVPVRENAKNKESDLHGKPVAQSQIPSDWKGKSIDQQIELKGSSDPGITTKSKQPPKEYAESSKANGDPVCGLLRREGGSVVSRFFIGLTLLGGGVPSSLHSTAGGRLLLLSLTRVSGRWAFIHVVG
ncbi:hypothetical protein YC2023_024903 [Brassica napus]